MMTYYFFIFLKKRFDKWFFISTIKLKKINRYYMKNNSIKKYLIVTNNQKELMQELKRTIKKVLWIYTPVPKTNQEIFFEELDSLSVNWKIPTESIKVAFTSWKYKIKKGKNYDTTVYWFVWDKWFYKTY